MPILLIGLLGLGTGAYLGFQTDRVIQTVIIGGVVYLVLKKKGVV